MKAPDDRQDREAPQSGQPAGRERAARRRLPRRAITWVVLVATAWIVHAACGRYVASHDVLAALLGARDLAPALAAAALLPARLFLYLLAPGWALYIAIRETLERRARP